MIDLSSGLGQSTSVKAQIGQKTKIQVEGQSRNNFNWLKGWPSWVTYRTTVWQEKEHSSISLSVSQSFLYLSDYLSVH